MKKIALVPAGQWANINYSAAQNGEWARLTWVETLKET